MTETVNPIPAPENDPSSKSGKGRRADYNQKLANDITDTKGLLETALADEELLAALSYSKEEIEAGLALAVAAQKAFDERQKAQGVAVAKKEAREKLMTEVMDDFTAFRTTVQTSLPTAARTPLGAKGVVPTDFQKRVTLMRGAYTTAQTADFAPDLAKRKITGAILAARVKQIEELEKLVLAFAAADKGATAATTARDAAGEAMQKWVVKFRKQVRSDLRHSPELLAKLGM